MYSKMRSISLIVFLVMAMAVSACAADRTSRTTGQAIDDNAIAAKVKSALIAAPDVPGTQVGIEVFQGVVQLSGFVDSTTQAQKAASIARGVGGVKEVRNNLQVK